MSGLSRRLRKLEGASRTPCSDCGLGPDTPVEDYEVLWHDTEGDEPGGAEFCETCGQQLVYCVVWADLPHRGEGRR